MFKRILVPVDPSKPFGPSNEYAVALAHRFDAQIVATYIIDEQLLGPVMGQSVGALDDALEWVGRDAMDDFAQHHPDLSIQKTLAYGNTATALFQMVLQTGADVVVLGGYHGMGSGHVWGSTVVDIMHHAEKPTFVVRSTPDLPKAGDRIVVPFDGSERPTEHLAKVTRFADAVGAIVDLVYVCRSGDDTKALEVLERGSKAVRAFGVPVESHILRGSFLRPKARAILHHARKVNSPMIAISRLGTNSIHTGRSRTVGSLVAHSEVPVWVVRR